MTGGGDSNNIESFLYGSYQDLATNQGMILSNDPVNQTSRAVNQTYMLSQSKGLQVSFYKFNQFRIYSKNQLFSYGSKNSPSYANLYIAYANIPLNSTSSRAPTQKYNVVPGMSTTSADILSASRSYLALVALAFFLCTSS
jgi:hypothetical protein